MTVTFYKRYRYFLKYAWWIICLFASFFPQFRLILHLLDPIRIPIRNTGATSGTGTAGHFMTILLAVPIHRYSIYSTGTGTSALGSERKKMHYKSAILISVFAYRYWLPVLVIPGMLEWEPWRLLLLARQDFFRLPLLFQFRCSVLKYEENINYTEAKGTFWPDQDQTLHN
jgi:hypothetical protein